MTAPAATARILVVANQTASTPRLLREVSESAKDGAQFTLLIPPECAQHRGSDWTSDDAAGMLAEAAGADVAVLDCGDDALDTIHGAVDAGQFDEIIVCTVPEHLSRWVHHDLPHRIEHLGLPGARDPTLRRRADPGPRQGQPARRLHAPPGARGRRRRGVVTRP